MLLKAGADVNIKDYTGRTPYDYVKLIKSDIRIINLLMPG